MIVCKRCRVQKDESSFTKKINSRFYRSWCNQCWNTDQDRLATNRHIGRGDMSCQKCRKTGMYPWMFDKKSDGSYKWWCRKCCGKRSKVLAKMYARRKDTGWVKKKHHIPDVTGYDGNCYETRKLNLKLIGFKTYPKYLKSDLWRSVRKRVYAVKGDICSLCPEPATALHHNRYHIDDLSGKTMEHIHPICDTCHEFIEFGKHGKKNSLQKARETFLIMQDTWFDICVKALATPPKAHHTHDTDRTADTAH